VRLACFLPWYLGMRTLVKLRETPPLATAQRVKVSRREVRAALLLACAAASSNTVLRAVRARIISPEKTRAVSR